MSRRWTTRGPLWGSVLATNLRRLIDYEAGGSVNAWAKRCSANQPTIARIANGINDANLGTLAAMLEGSRYEPWQLLHPDFDPATAPPLGDARAMRLAHLFSRIETEHDKQRAEAMMGLFVPAEPGDGVAADSSVKNTRSR